MTKHSFSLPLATLALIGMTSLPVPTALAAKGCPKPKPVTPQSASANASEVPDLEVLKVTGKATEAKPLVVEFHQEPGMWTVDGTEPIVDSSVFHNLQLVTKKKAVSATIRAEWATPAVSDLDYYLFLGGGEFASSTAFNPAPALNQSTGGEGFEQIDFVGGRCAVYTLESRPFLSPTGEDVTLKIWLS